jgi:V/A-type H+/Na+-transporting ATPase subunit C
MKTARLLFLISRTHGLRAHLLKTQDFVHLLTVRNLGEMNDHLLKTDYSAELSRVTTTQVTALQLEHIFSEKLSNRWYSLAATSSGKIRNLLEVHNLRLEIENLKRIVRVVHGKQSITEEQLFTIPHKYQNVNLRALMVAKTMFEVIDLLKVSPYKDLEDWLEEYERYGNPIILEAQLDKIYYDDFRSALHKTPDSGEIWTLIGTQVDMRNVQLAISSKYMKIQPDVLQKMIVDEGYRLSKNATSRLVGSDLQGIPGVLSWPSYVDLAHKVVELIEEGRIFEMDTLFSRFLHAYAEKMSIRNPNSLVYVFSYLDLCLREAKNLTTLGIGKQMNVASERLRSLMSF